MNTIRILPTDRDGNLYYGPTTIAEGQREIDLIVEDFHDACDRAHGEPAELRVKLEAKIAKLRKSIHDAGYPGVAARLAAKGGAK